MHEPRSSAARAHLSPEETIRKRAEALLRRMGGDHAGISDDDEEAAAAAAAGAGIGGAATRAAG